MNDPRKVIGSFPTAFEFAFGKGCHLLSSISNDPRRVNNLKNDEKFSSHRRHDNSFKLRTVSESAPKQALSESSSKAANEMRVRVSDSRLVEAKRWILARRSSCAPKSFGAVGSYFGTS